MNNDRFGNWQECVLPEKEAEACFCLMLARICWPRRRESGHKLRQRSSDEGFTSILIPTEFFLHLILFNFLEMFGLTCFKYLTHPFRGNFNQIVILAGHNLADWF